MTGKSAAIVGFLANLLPLYTGEQRDGVWCARSMQDGTLVLPVDESGHDEELGTLRVHWQSDPQREQHVDGTYIVTLALDRYVRLHGGGASEEAIASELWHMARHFHFKTGSHAYLPQLPEPPHPLMHAGRTALRVGEGVLINLMSRIAGI